ncbi:DUF3604 domain-containing protein, partial [Myxococcota bacterium]|nr:DUF3604 domain-containing protein [Myxococcota bacterium]
VFGTFGLAPAFLASAKGERCYDHNPEKNVYWGDLHVHTSYSMDAYMFDARLTPRDAYRFAKGAEVKLPPLDEQGRGTVPYKLDRPLDFAAVTDHSEALGGVQICTNPKHPSYGSETCVRYRSPLKRGSVGETATDIHDRIESLRSTPLCGADWATCREALKSGWQEIQEAAARADDKAPACTFTTFVAYEHTNTPNLTKIHRNVIFRNEKVPAFPITAADEPDALKLWQRLEQECKQGVPGCDVLAIPHNPNLSNGHIFTIEYPEGATLDDQRRYASLKARMEPVTEMMQIKGESECRSGFWKVMGADEDCNFEKIRGHEKAVDCQDKTGEGALGGKGCESRLDFARYALIEGLREAERIGVNPYAFGQIGSTDIHTGTPGATEEWKTETFDGRMRSPGYNLGGLAAIWAEENTREALFEGLRRREVYATSGPRMEVRLFGGWDLPADLCASGQLVQTGYSKGVPMGSDLPPRPAAGAAAAGAAKTSGADAKPEGANAAVKSGPAPRFVVSALRDTGTPAHPGNALQRIQIVKGWADADGTFHQQVIDVVGSRNNGATVDTQTCEPKGPGESQLCAVWTDPDFDPSKRAVYYARVFENPSCRFSTYACNAKKGADRPAMCDDPAYPKTIQERAWTSPIWYSPLNPS